MVLLDPDPVKLVGGMDPDSDLVPDSDPSSIKQNSKINLVSYCFVNSFILFIFKKNDQNISSQNNKLKILFCDSF